MEHNISKSRLLFFMFLVITFPLLENSFNFIESGSLSCAVEAHSDIKFSPVGWWDGSYQKEKTLFLNDSVGFRPDLVRLTNQFNFWVFKILPNGTYVGNDNYLINREYVDEYEGRCYGDYEKVRNTIRKLKLIQDTLERAGKTFIFVIAPSKPYFMPQNIPLCLRRSGGPKISNYTCFQQLIDSSNIKYLDFNALFKKMKDTSRAPLFSRQGAHWSLFGSLLASDFMSKFIEKQRNIKLPRLEITKYCYPDTIISPDNDMVRCSNLIFPAFKEKLCYPEYHYVADNAKTDLKIIFIGDSFGGQWIANKYMQGITTNWEFWYYFNNVWNTQNIFNGAVQISNGYNWQQALSNAECLVIEFNPTNLQGQILPTACIERIYKMYYNN